MIAAYLKCISKKKGEWCFPFWIIFFFCFRDTHVFVNYANEESYESEKCTS